MREVKVAGKMSVFSPGGNLSLLMICIVTSAQGSTECAYKCTGSTDMEYIVSQYPCCLAVNSCIRDEYMATQIVQIHVADGHTAQDCKSLIITVCKLM